MKICRLIFWLFAVLYVLALVVLAIGTYGLFGADRDPLSGAFVVVLGMPWTRLIDVLPEPLWPAAAALAPLVNLLLIQAICRLIGRWRS